MSVIETIAAGCYLLLSDIEAHRQLVPDDEFYFEAHNVNKLAELISKRISVGAESYSYNLARYDWGKIIKKIYGSNG